jgi:putative transposase
VRILCLTLEVEPSGYYAWLKHPVSQRERDDKNITRQIKQFWLESGGHYGYRNIYLDLQEAGMLVVEIGYVA